MIDFFSSRPHLYLFFSVWHRVVFVIFVANFNVIIGITSIKWVYHFEQHPTFFHIPSIHTCMHIQQNMRDITNKYIQYVLWQSGFKNSFWDDFKLFQSQLWKQSLHFHTWGVTSRQGSSHARPPDFYCPRLEAATKIGSLMGKKNNSPKKHPCWTNNPHTFFLMRPKVTVFSTL